MLRECWFEVYAPWHIVVLATIITIKTEWDAADPGLGIAIGWVQRLGARLAEVEPLR